MKQLKIFQKLFIKHPLYKNVTKKKYEFFFGKKKKKCVRREKMKAIKLKPGIQVFKENIFDF